MTIGIYTKQYIKKLALLGGLLAFLGGSAVLVDGVLAQTSDDIQVTDTDEHVLSIHDRGEQRVVITKARTVKEALKLADIEISEGRDVVEPALSEELVAQRYNINIYRARPITVVDGMVKKSITTAEKTPSRIAEAAGLEIYPEDDVEFTVAQDLVAYGASQVMSIERATPLELVLYGKKSQIRTKSATVGELLEEKGLTLGEDDFLSVSKDQSISAGMVVELWRDGKQTVTVEEEVDFPVEQIQDANREVGYREVRTAGKKGLRNATYEIDMKNGQEVTRTEIASVMTVDPQKQVEVVGAKPRTMPYTGGGNKDSWLAASGIPQDQWGYAEAIVQRESGWNPNAVNPLSGACGLAQALPCSKVPGNPYDPVNSLRWMNSYVTNRYYDGSPYAQGLCGGASGGWECAYMFWNVKKWY